MSEYFQGFTWSLGILISLIYATFWWIGGRPGGRTWRRWVAPLFFSISLVGFSLLTSHFNWWYLLLIPIYKGVAHIGYGANSLWGKITRRTLWSLIYSLGALFIALISGEWIIFSVQVTFSLTASIIFGVLNPFNSSPKEEGSVCFASSFMIPFML